MKLKSIFIFILAIQGMVSLTAMQKQGSIKRKATNESVGIETLNSKINATSINKLEQYIESEKVTFPLTALVQAHLASNERESFAQELLDYLESPATYDAKNLTRYSLACKWIKNAASRIFPKMEDALTHLVINACDASLDPSYTVGKNGLGFFSIFKFLESSQAQNAYIEIETLYQGSQNKFKSYFITLEKAISTSSINDPAIIATFDFNKKSSLTSSGTIIRIKPGNEKFSPTLCQTLEYSLYTSLRFYPHLPITLYTNQSIKYITLLNTTPNKGIQVFISPDEIIVQGQGTGILLWTALQNLLIPGNSTKSHIPSSPEKIEVPHLADAIDLSQKDSHFFITVNGVTIFWKQLTTPLLNHNGKSLDVWVTLPSSTRTTLSFDDIIIHPNGMSKEETYLKNMIRTTIDKTCTGNLEHEQILYALYQGLDLWEQQSSQTHIQGLFSKFLQDELNKKLSTHNALAAPLEFMEIYNRFFRINNSPNIIPVAPSLVYNNYDPLEKYLVQQGRSKFQNSTIIQTKGINKELIFGQSIFFIPIQKTSHYGLQSCIFAPESLITNFTTEENLINNLIISLPEKRYQPATLAQSSTTHHLTKEQRHLYKWFYKQHEPLFQRFGIKPEKLINPTFFEYAWIENITKPLNTLIPDRPMLMMRLMQDSLSFNMLTCILNHLQVPLEIQNLFAQIRGTHKGGYEDLFTFSSSNLPFCYGKPSTTVFPLFDCDRPVIPCGTIAPLINKLTQDTQCLEKIMQLQTQDFIEKTKSTYRDGFLSKLQLYVPNTLTGTPLFLLGVLAKRKDYSLQTINLIKTITHLVQSPAELALLSVSLMSLSNELFNFSCTPTGLKVLTSIVQYHIQKKVAADRIKNFYHRMHLSNSTSPSSFIDLAKTESFCIRIKSIFEKFMLGQAHVSTTQSTLPPELEKQAQNLYDNKSFFLSQLFKAHCQDNSFTKLLESEELETIINQVTHFPAGGLKKIEQCIEAISEKNYKEASIIESLQNSIDAVRDFYQKSNGTLNLSGAQKLATIDMILERCPINNLKEAIKFTIHDNAGFPHLKTLLTHFVLPDLSDKSPHNGSIGEMGNGSFKMYQGAHMVHVLTRTTGSSNICYLLSIEPQRSPITGLVVDLKLTCRNVSSLVSDTFYGTSITITFQEEPFNATEMTLGSIVDFLYNAVGSTTAHLAEQVPFSVILKIHNKSIMLNKDSAKQLVASYADQNNNTQVQIFKRPQQHLQSFITTAGIPFCAFDTFVREQNLLPSSLIKQLEKEYIIDFAPGAYKPIQSRTKLQSALSKKNLRRILLNIFYQHGLNQAFEEQKLLQEKKSLPQDSFLATNFTHFLSQSNLFQLMPSLNDAALFTDALERFLQSGIWQANVLESKFFDFYHFYGHCLQSFSGYLHEIDALLVKCSNEFNDQTIQKIKAQFAHEMSSFSSITTPRALARFQNKLITLIEQYLKNDYSTLMAQQVAQYNYTISMWYTDVLSKLGTSSFDCPQQGLFRTIIMEWINKKMHPSNYSFDTKLFAQFYASSIINSLSPLNLTGNSPATTPVLTLPQLSEEEQLTNFFDTIHTLFCHEFFTRLGSNNYLTCQLSKDLPEIVLGYYDVQRNRINLNSTNINFYELIKLINLIKDFDLNTDLIANIQNNKAFHTLYWPSAGNVPTLIHELEHVRRYNLLSQYPTAGGCENHDDGYDPKGNCVNFNACAQSWAEHAFAQGLLPIWIAQVQDELKKNPAIINLIERTIAHPFSEESRKLIQNLSGVKELSRRFKSQNIQGSSQNSPQSAANKPLMYHQHINNSSQLQTFLAQHNINEQDHAGWTVLHHAVNKRNQPLIKELLKRKANPNIKNNNGDTPLHLIYNGSNHSSVQNIVDSLISAEANLGICNNNGDTPLHCSIDKKITITKEVLQKLGNINVANSTTGMTLLHKISECGSEDSKLLDLLLSYGADVTIADKQGNLPIHYAAKARSENFLKTLVSRSPTSINARNLLGQTPLFFAIKNKSIRIVYHLLDKGADVNDVDIHGNNIFHLLASCQTSPSLDFIKGIINSIGEKKASDLISQPNYYGALPLHVIQPQITNTIFKLFVVKTKNLNDQDMYGNTPLHRLVFAQSTSNFDNHTENVKYLARHKKAINSHFLRNGYGLTPYLCTSNKNFYIFLKYEELLDQVNDFTNTPLHWAAEKGLTHYVCTLIQCGQFHVNSSLQGMSALHLATYHGHLETVQKLIELGANIHQRDLWGHTALHWAAVGGHAEIGRYLLTQGVKPEVQDYLGKTAFDLALSMGKHDFCQIDIFNPA